MKWMYPPSDGAAVKRLCAELQSQPAFGRSPTETVAIVAELLVRRQINDAETALRYLKPSADHLHAPERMLGLRAAVDRIDAAIDRKEPMLIYGDYDVDGTMAVIILKTAIELCGGVADFHVPHRIREGYDLRQDVIEASAAAGIRLIISVDMGIRAFAPAETALRCGVDLIVTDHHLPGPDGVPKALAVINPNQPGCEYPYKQLCGAGVAFKLAQALMQRRLAHKDLNKILLSFMKVAAIATIADAVPLTGENRIFARLGLEALRIAVNPGLKALLEMSQIPTERAPNAGEIAFRIAPRINAAGRMDVARDVIELFSVKERGRARELAAKLDHLNAERQDEERRILDAVEERFSKDPALCEAGCIVIDGDGWHRGVIGITATRIVERYHRPAIVISREGDEAFGSGRSIRAFHLLEAMESCGDLFTRYGGHAHACGFAMPAANIAALREKLNACAKARLTPADFEAVLDVDADIAFDQITPSLFDALQQLEPYGVANPEPVFSAHALRLTTPPRILKDKHVKLKLKAPDRAIAAVATAVGADERLPIAIVTTPRCDPDSAGIRRSARSAALEEVQRLHASGNLPAAAALRTDHAEIKANSWRDSITLEAVGWHMAERLQKEMLLAGDAVDIAFCIGHNDHPAYGGLELTLTDLKTIRK